MSEESETFKLYKFEYLHLGDNYTQWVWLKDDEEARTYMADDEGVSVVIYRQATKEESDLYEEAFEDGRGLGVAETRMEFTNGVVYKLNKFEPKDDGVSLDTTKLFKCGQCEQEMLDFEVKAATTGEYYVSIEKESVLWYVCTDCAYDCRHDWTHFSRTICACGSMHDYCDTCGEALGCRYNDEDNSDSPYRRRKK